MNTQIIKVYYDQNALPYKDRERTVHFPITGSTFIGSSDTTKIRFYVDDYLADENALWISVSKRADGTQGSQFLTSGTDENGDKYREMTLSGWYTEKKGDLYISLKGYQGGTTGYWDEETGMYIVQGVPVIRATGSIKLAINYAPVGEYPYYQDEMASFQDLVAQLGNKLNITSGIVVVSDISIASAILYTDGQLIYDKATKSLYVVSNGAFVSFFETYDKDTLDTKFDKKADKATTYTKTETDNAIASAVSSVYKYKGSVATYSDLPSSDLTIGDVYNVEDTGDNYAWTGTTWDKLGGTVDLSDYATKSELTSGLATKQNTLVSGQNIKTINGQSILGSGDLPVSGGGSAEWGSIGGDIDDQTDLQNELQDIREVAEGKCRTFVISYLVSVSNLPNENNVTLFKKTNGENFTSWQEFLEYVNENICYNSDFNSQDNYVQPKFYDNQGGFILTNDRTIIVEADLPYQTNDSKLGDIFLVEQIDVPDRWYGGGYNFYKLETSKIDLDNYATKTEVNAKSDLTNVAPAYDNTLTYTIGEVVSYNGKIYKCTTAITTPESWDSTHWAETSVASDFVNLTGTQTISGEKTLSSNKYLYFGGTNSSIGSNGSKVVISAYEDLIFRSGRDGTNTFIRPYEDATESLGRTSYRYKNLYLSNNLTDGTNSVTVANISNGLFNVINASDIVNNTLTPAQYDLITNGKPTKIYGSLLGLSNPLLITQTGINYGAIQFLMVGTVGTDHQVFTLKVDTSSKALSIRTSPKVALGTNLSGAVSIINDISINQYYKKPQSSVSLSDGGTITDNTLKTLIQNEQPIKLNGFTCYFSCDDGTNYQYVSTRLDGNTNKTHFNVITINKSTWVAYFHTSDIALS